MFELFEIAKQVPMELIVDVGLYIFIISTGVLIGVIHLLCLKEMSDYLIWCVFTGFMLGIFWYPLMLLMILIIPVTITAYLTIGVGKLVRYFMHYFKKGDIHV